MVTPQDTVQLLTLPFQNSIIQPHISIPGLTPAMNQWKHCAQINIPSAVISGLAFPLWLPGILFILEGSATGLPTASALRLNRFLLLLRTHSLRHPGLRRVLSSQEVLSFQWTPHLPNVFKCRDSVFYLFLFQSTQHSMWYYIHIS